MEGTSNQATAEAQPAQNQAQAPAAGAPAKAEAADAEKAALAAEVAKLRAQLEGQAKAETAPPQEAKPAGPSKYVLVENTSERMHGVPERQPPKGKGVRVRKPYVNLWPGVNRIPVADWDRARAEPMIKLHMEQVQPPTFVELARVAELSDVPVRDAVAWLKRCWEPVLLKEWAAKDGRPEVQQAIKAQHDAIKGERAEPDKPAKRATMKTFAARMAGNG